MYCLMCFADIVKRLNNLVFISQNSRRYLYKLSFDLSCQSKQRDWLRLNYKSKLSGTPPPTLGLANPHYNFWYLSRDINCACFNSQVLLQHLFRCCTLIAIWYTYSLNLNLNCGLLYHVKHYNYI